MHTIRNELHHTWYNKFAQKRLQAWQPIMTPAFTIPIYIVFGLIFVIIGISIDLATKQVFEFKHDYTVSTTDENGVGSFEFELSQDVEPPLWLHYELDGFHQNHRRYIKNYDYDQLSQPEQWQRRRRTEGARRRMAMHKCTPIDHDSIGRTVYPCGLVPTSMFNDSFVLLQKKPGQSDWERVEVDDEAESIAWPSDIKGRFIGVNPEHADPQTGKLPQDELDYWILKTFPPVECHQVNFSGGRPWVPASVALREEWVTPSETTTQYASMEVDCRGYSQHERTCNFTRLGMPFQCTGDYKTVQRRGWGIESGHFLVWMRAGGLPLFRKAWGKVSQRFYKGTMLKVFFTDNFPAKQFQGSKALVLATSGSIGGADDALGHFFLAVGSACLLFGAWKVLQCVYVPRRLGDVSFLLAKQAGAAH